MAYLSRKLATIKTDCDIDYNIDDFVLDFPFSTEAYQFFKEMDFTSLINNATLFKDVNVEEATVTKVERLPLDNDKIKEFKNFKDKHFSYDLKSLEFMCNGKLYFIEKT